MQWLPLLTTSDDVEKTFQGMQDQGIKVVRTWVISFYKYPLRLSWLTLPQGFNAINGSELEGALQSGLTYYQVTILYSLHPTMITYLVLLA